MQNRKGWVFMRVSLLAVKMAIVLTAGSFSLGAAAQDVQFTQQQRSSVMSEIPRLVNEQFFTDDETLSGCWEAAKKGDDTSLFAVYVAAKAYPIMVKYREGMGQAATMSGSNDDRFQALKNAFDAIDYQEANAFLSRFPGAIMHCIEVSGGVNLDRERNYLSREIRKELNL